MSIAKVVVAVTLGVGVGAAFLVRYPFPFSLAWPGLVLARFGVPHSWLFAVLLILAFLVWLGLRSRGRAWWQAVTVSLFVSLGYCAIAFLYVARLSVPLPAVTIYDYAAEQRVAYLDAYDSGYRDGMLGIHRTYCFYPEAETRGFEEGSRQGLLVWYRLLGRKTPEWLKRAIERSVATRGVRSEPKSNSGQPDGAENRSQRIRAETDPISVAAGSDP